MEAKHECEYCGRPFQPTCHATRQIFCSKECRIKNNNANRYAPPGNACLECGASLEQCIQRGRNRKFCGEACKKTHHVKKMLEKKRIERQIPRPCPNCGKDFVPMWEIGGTPRFCSDECRIEWWREYHKAHPISGEPNTKCAYCGLKTDGSGGKYCSRACYRLGAAHIVLYEYQTGRHARYPKAFLQDFRGFLHADGYEGYHDLPQDISVVGCWAHVRRKFDEALKAIPTSAQTSSPPMEAIRQIGQLYKLEEEFQKLSPDDKFKARQQSSRPLVDTFFDW